MMDLRKALKLYFVMGSPNCRLSPEETLIEAIKGGITFFQFREKGERSLEGTERLELAVKLRDICREHSIPFIVNDDVELAMKTDADGVHIGQDDECIQSVRSLIGDKLLGVSAHNIDEAKRAQELGADYLGVGPMFPTQTKRDIQAVRGPIAIREIRQAGVCLPIVGIGGITPSNAKEVLLQGADGVAVISAISMAESPGQAALSFRVL